MPDLYFQCVITVPSPGTLVSRDQPADAGISPISDPGTNDNRRKPLQ
jgi:hypothetical protein